MAEITNRIDRPSFDNRNDNELGTGGGGGTNHPIYYAKLTVKFVNEKNEPVTGVSYYGTYGSYNSDGSSITNSLRGGVTYKSDTIEITLYSYFPSKTGTLTLNAKISSGSAYITEKYSFKYATVSSEKNATTTNVEFKMHGSRIILPSIYKPFFFNAALKFVKDEDKINFYCSIANAIPYRLNDGNYVIGTPELTIDNTTWYFYNDVKDYQVGKKLSDDYVYNTCILSTVEMTTEKDYSRYFYAPSEASSFTKNYEIKFIVRFDSSDIDPTLPHNYSFSVEEGMPKGYNGGLPVTEAEDALYGVKFSDVTKGITNSEGTYISDYVYMKDAAFGGIRDFFLDEDVYPKRLDESLSGITALNDYVTEPKSWKSIHTLAWKGKSDYNFYDFEFETETDSDNNVNMHFKTPNQSGMNLFKTAKTHYMGLVDKYTMLSGSEINDTSTDYGTETTEGKYTLYTKVPRHTSVLSVIYIQKFV